ncbi:class I SAM-dependent methyltransferase [Saccharopolyspora sp. WRP15-2]|uniref:S-adenosyl-L-methionine-dependent methyltransferase n=1 Tax=Saccharopolyspora oryzae TaxID=2997343 RepID=A0ABT4VAU8_9PSEU|nr:class I SAM-dependent methyltransferase [Saccharopolyspora oryzae]MDA3631078.1 class I SAM-dependent methyltransferase [Saccharopolyspora oryzae]
MVATARAAHLVVDDSPAIFTDSLAEKLLGDRAEELIGYHRLHGDLPLLSHARANVVVRSRYLEDRLAALVDRGLPQYVILGAGLDTFAYRNPTAPLAVFEVDHPATQQWKRKLLADSGVDVPEMLRWVPVDFETDQLLDQLVAAGFDPTRPALISWLGVTMYLTWEAVDRTLDVLGGLAPGTELVLDYVLPEHLSDQATRTHASAVAQAVSDSGEPWLSRPTPDALTTCLAEHGFGPTKHVRHRDAIDSALWQREDSLSPSGLSMLAHTELRA